MLDLYLCSPPQSPPQCVSKVVQSQRLDLNDLSSLMGLVWYEMLEVNVQTGNYFLLD